LASIAGTSLPAIQNSFKSPTNLQNKIVGKYGPNSKFNWYFLIYTENWMAGIPLDFNSL